MAAARQLRVVVFPDWVAPGTTKAWVNHLPAQTPRQLVVHGGFEVDDGRTRHLEQRARTLGFVDLRGYLQARSDAGLSIPRLAAELGVSEWTVKRALREVGVTRGMVKSCGSPVFDDHAATS
jgi:AraC-like DNA-binding protein